MAWNGIGIGWPNASSQSTPVVIRSGRFALSEDCSGTIFTDGTYTQYLIDTSLQEGDYVYYPERGTRIPLGNFYEEEVIINVEINIQTSPVYNSCEI